LKIVDKTNIVTIIDIGSSKIVCLVAKITQEKITILGMGCQSSNGFKNGNIVDAIAARLSIIAAVTQAEKESGIIIEKVVLALNGNKICSHYISASVSIKKHNVSNQDVEALILQGIKQLEEKGYEVIHYVPLSYNIDGNADVKNPNGLLGKNIAAKIHFVTVASNLLDNIVNCLGGCQIDVEDCVFSPYASGLATLDNRDKEIGSTVIDFGDGIISYALFSENKMVNCGFIPIGSRAITNDIAKSFMLDLSTAERIKTIYGAANVNYIDAQKMIHIDNEERNISNAELNEVISARVEEVLLLIKQILTKPYASYPNASQSIVLTGGGSMLIGISDKTAKIFTSKVRLGKPITIEGMNHNIVNATYAAAIGVLQYINNNHSKNSVVNKISPIKKIINWIKYNL
jgi:cell division protein FtsA